MPSPCRARTRWSTRERCPQYKPGQLRTQEENLSSLTPLPQDTLRDGGQTGQEGGHIGRCGETGGGASATCGTRRGGKAVGQSWWPWMLAELWVRQKRVAHAETSSTPSERCRTLAKGGPRQISSPSALTPVVATQTLVGWAPTLPPPLDMATTEHSRKGTVESGIHHRIFAVSRELETWTGPYLEISDHCRCNVAMAFPHHLKTVSPTGEMGCGAHPMGASKPQTTARE